MPCVSQNRAPFQNLYSYCTSQNGISKQPLMSLSAIKSELMAWILSLGQKALNK
jgi:hypothetical protein